MQSCMSFICQDGKAHVPVQLPPGLLYLASAEESHMPFKVTQWADGDLWLEWHTTLLKMQLLSQCLAKADSYVKATQLKCTWIHVPHEPHKQIVVETCLHWSVGSQ